jgi:hypothetical protein
MSGGSRRRGPEGSLYITNTRSFLESGTVREDGTTSTEREDDVVVREDILQNLWDGSRTRKHLGAHEGLVSGPLHQLPEDGSSCSLMLVCGRPVNHCALAISRQS